MALPRDRRRAPLSQGLLPPDDRRRRPPGARLPRLRPRRGCRSAGSRTRSGLPLTVTVELPGRDLFVAVWVAQVGRVPVLLLDTDMPENADADRPITNILYVRGREMRLHQELVLGIGGVRAIRALGLSPAVWHLNEGHSAFLLAERAREHVGDRDVARRRLARRPARQRVHDPHAGLGRQRAVRQPTSSGASPDRCSTEGGDPGRRASSSSAWAWTATQTQFDMTAFSLRLTSGANAVSQLHAETANETWQGIIDHPILGITNGIHGPTWIGPPIAEPARGPGRRPRRPRRRAPSAAGSGSGSTGSPPRNLWEAHLRQKRELAHFARGRLRNQFARHGEAPSVLAELETALDPDVLTIGFARRFATYKRAGLLFTDIDRLARMLWDADRPIQVVFAGKAHPADRPGQRVIQEIFQRSRSTQLRGRVFILEDYDMRVARFLVQGVDVWLNNPRRPLEASGTSGMKAAQNGVPNVSVLDGWWDEGFDGGQRLGDRRPRDRSGRGRAGLARRPGPLPDPRGGDRAGLLRARRGTACRRAGWPSCAGRWRSALWQFSTTRMLHEYTERLYLPAAGVPVEAVPAPAVTEAG